MTDEEMIAEGATYGVWINPDKPDKATSRKGMLEVLEQAAAWGNVTQAGSRPVAEQRELPRCTPRNHPDWPRRIVVVGGQKFDEPALDSWLIALRAKYPGATVVTGAARGSEAYVVERAGELGMTVEVTPREEWWPDSILQVEASLIGADVIVVVGSVKAQRAARAIAKHKLVDAWRDGGRPLVCVAAPEKAAAPKGRRVAAVNT